MFVKEASFTHACENEENYCCFSENYAYYFDNNFCFYWLLISKEHLTFDAATSVFVSLK